MCTSPTRHTRTFAQSPKKTVCRHNASKNSALITDETLPYHKEGADRAVTLVGWEGAPSAGAPGQLAAQSCLHQAQTAAVAAEAPPVSAALPSAQLLQQFVQPTCEDQASRSSQRALSKRTQHANLTLVRASV